MRLIREIKYYPRQKHGCVLTLGNFDGVHLGHKAVIKQLDACGKKTGLPVVIMLFEPQPLEYLLRNKAPVRLMCLREKVTQLAKLPVDDIVLARFNNTLADCNHQQFIDDILVKKLHVKFLVVGDDFHFGKDRGGNFKTLKNKGKQLGFIVQDTTSFLVSGLRVSSTLIREALAADDLNLAEKMLGRSYSICGRIEHGEKRGRVIGFPTANIQMLRKNTPVEGVFAVTMSGIDNRIMYGVANVGTRPTFGGKSCVALEVYLFDFDQQIYGRYVEVSFKQKIRNEIHFQSLDNLKLQIKKDVAIAKKILKNS